MDQGNDDLGNSPLMGQSCFFEKIETPLTWARLIFGRFQPPDDIGFQIAILSANFPIG
jgi:hypothetical protein